MNDKANGALEALGWVRGLLKELKSSRKVDREIAGAIEDLLAGSSVDFRNHLRRYG